MVVPDIHIWDIERVQYEILKGFNMETTRKVLAAWKGLYQNSSVSTLGE